MRTRLLCFASTTMFPYTHFSFLTHRKSARHCHAEPQASRSNTDWASILVVEFRDEVFAAIHAQLASQEIVVINAPMADAVLTTLQQCKPWLILINAEMPDESGFLISHKLRMHGFQGELWLYSACTNDSHRGFQEFCQVDHLFNYGGDIRTLTSHLKRFIKQQ